MSQDRRVDDTISADLNPSNPSAPGRSTVTSRLSPRALIFRVESAEAARELGSAFGKRDGNGVASGADSFVQRAAESSGDALPASIKGQFESSLGADLSAVRVHTGSASAEAASAVGARAYTTGNDIHFAEGQYAPTDAFGLHLLAHEVAHTQQQAATSTTTQYKLEVSTPGDSLEQEADRAADAMIVGAPAQIAAASMTLARDKDPNAKKDKDEVTIDLKKIATLQGKITTTQAKLRGSNTKLVNDSKTARTCYKAARTAVKAENKAFEEAYKKVSEELKKAKEAIEGEDEFKKFLLDVALEMVAGAAFEGEKAGAEVVKHVPFVVHAAKEVAKSVGMEIAGEGAGDLLGIETKGKDKVDISETKTAADRELDAVEQLDEAIEAVDEQQEHAIMFMDASQDIGQANTKLSDLKSDKTAEGAKTLSKIEGALGNLPTIEKECATVDATITALLAKAKFAQTLAEKQLAAATPGALEREIWANWLGKLSGDEILELREKDGIREALELYNLKDLGSSEDAARARKCVGKTAQSYGASTLGAGKFMVRVVGVNGTFCAVRAPEPPQPDGPVPATGLVVEGDTIPSGACGTVVGVNSSGWLVVAAHFVTPDAKPDDFANSDSKDPIPTMTIDQVLAMEKGNGASTGTPTSTGTPAPQGPPMDPSLMPKLKVDMSF